MVTSFRRSAKYQNVDYMAGFPGPLAASYGRVLSFVNTFNFVLYFLEHQMAFADSDPDDILVKA